MDFHPFFFTLRQMPNPVSNIIANIATYTIGFTGEMTAKNDVAKSVKFAFKISKIL
jgi:hypothetical protein